VLGNPIHLAPEQLHSRDPLTPRTDVYALAETAYWVLAGRHPYHAEGIAAKLAMKSSGPLASILDMRPDLPGAIDDVLRTGMATEPADRFGSVTEFAQALAGAAGRRTQGKKWWEFWK
jgi:serine/threonine-protein kinase